MAVCWKCVCGKANLPKDDKCVRCREDRGIGKELENPVAGWFRGEFHNAIESLYEKMLRAKTTTYGPNCNLTKAQISLGMGAATLRQKGHAEMAALMDAEIERIQSIPDLDTDIANYMIGIIWQWDLMTEMYEYAKKHGLVDDILPYMRLHAARVRNISS